MKQANISSSLMLCITLAGGCGFSESINSNLHDQERQFEVEASKQMLQQSNLIVGSVIARSTLVEPQATARCESVPMSQCTVCYVASDTEQSINLSTPACLIDPPSQGQELSLQLSLRDLSFAATQTTPSTVTLRGEGHLDISAQIPIVGMYGGTAAYVVQSGEVNTANGSFSIDLRMTYQSGDKTLVELSVVAQGSPNQIQGRITGATLDCKVTGSLKAPVVSCSQ